jgi:hypothetical protein
MGARPTYCEVLAPDTPSRGSTIENGAEGRKRYPHGRRRRPCPFGGGLAPRKRSVPRTSSNLLRTLAAGLDSRSRTPYNSEGHQRGTGRGASAPQKHARGQGGGASAGRECVLAGRGACLAGGGGGSRGLAVVLGSARRRLRVEPLRCGRVWPCEARVPREAGRREATHMALHAHSDFHLGSHSALRLPET